MEFLVAQPPNPIVSQGVCGESQSGEEVCMTLRIVLNTASRARLVGSVGSWRCPTWERARVARCAKKAKILSSSIASDAKNPKC